MVRFNERAREGDMMGAGGGLVAGAGTFEFGTRREVIILVEWWIAARDTVRVITDVEVCVTV